MKDCSARRIAALGCLGLAALGAGAVFSAPAAPPPIAPRIVPRAAAAPDAAPRVLADISYGPDPAQKMDVYLPAGFAGPRPGVELIHGGGWQGGDKNFYAPWAGRWPHAASWRSRSTTASPRRPATRPRRTTCSGPPGGCAPARGSTTSTRPGWVPWATRQAGTCP